MSNQAAWLMEAKQHPFTIAEAPMPIPGPHEIVVKTRAVAINPVDFAIQAFGMIIETYPHIIGYDAAGEIAAIGSQVTKFKVGDRVFGFADNYDTHKATNSAFQLYFASTEKAFVELPHSIPFTQGVVLPVCMFTAMAVLFMKDTLALPFPTIDAKPREEIVFVWGGSTSVGACAIQMLKGAGFEVATTASSHNEGFCKDLDVDYYFNRSDGDVVENVVQGLSGKKVVGVCCAIIDEDSERKCGQIISRLGVNKVLATVRAPGMPMAEGLPDGVKAVPG